MRPVSEECLKLIPFVVAVVVSGCEEGWSPTADSHLATAAYAETSALPVSPSSQSTSGCHAEGAQCRFDKGVTTCTRIVSQETHTGAHDEVSGCMTFDGTSFVPGRRTRSFSDTFVVTTTEMTRAHGRCGRIFESSTTQQQELASSVMTSDRCEAI
jgi:hypothetical protein